MAEHAFIQGSEEDYNEIIKLAQNQNWHGALEIIDRILPKVNEKERAYEIFQTILTYDPLATILSKIMTIRGLCFLRIIQDGMQQFMEKTKTEHGKATVPLNAYVLENVELHAYICLEVFKDHADLLWCAAGAASMSGYHEIALKLAQRVKQIEPSKSGLKTFINNSESAIKTR